MNLSFTMRFGLLAGLFLFVAHCLPAQTSRETALGFLREHPAKFGLSAADVADLHVTDEYVTRHNGVTHVWVQQQYAGIPVFNALFGLHVLPNKEVATVGHRFVTDLQAHVNTTAPSLSAYKALEMAMNDLGFTGFSVPTLRQKINERNFVFAGGAVSRADIPVSACYAIGKDGSARLAWTMIIEQANTSDVWNLRVDAQTGRVLDKINQTVYCKTDHTVVNDHCEETALAALSPAEQPFAHANGPLASEQYRVFPLPLESPDQGPRQLVVNPASPTASPFGWLDTNGQAGAEYTYTRGNNVYAYNDADNDNAPPATPQANGGAALNFDFPFDPNAEPTANLEAAITNLFYMNNMMHDISYGFGFNEAAGNFQARNYSGAGIGNDAVQAEAIDGGGENNANFSTPADGSSGRMQMFRWSRQGGKIFNVIAPSPAVGSYFAAASSGRGGTITEVPVTGEVIIADDGTGSGDSIKGCNPASNSLTGKIALVERGVCEFGHKALLVQQAGAIACIICNFQEGTAAMGAGAEGAQVTIPVVMLQKSDCDFLKQFIGNGLTVSLVQPLVSGPDYLDGDFDNGVMAHEYGHGISTRLTGGPANSGCLGNAEEMGEGWSDFFALVTAAKVGDVGTKKRGLGNYVVRQDVNGVGIRRYPYSTDLNVNPLLFSTVAENTEVHALGEVWAAVTWDLYWALSDKYGYDPTLANVNSGSYRAVQLVMDGLKLQPCSPGFLDGRDAIILADKLSYSSEDTCLITSVFARRGFGVGASQGTTDNAADGVENFDPIPTCIKELKIKKTCTPTILPGETATFTITITNHKDDTAAGVVVNDELPAGMTFQSASNGGTYSNGVVTWNLGNIPTGQVITLTYTAKYAATTGSPLLFQDILDSDVEWTGLTLLGGESFALQTDVVKVGAAAWKAGESSTEKTEMTLEPISGDPFLISGAQPTLRFWQQYNTESGADAGFIEVQKDGELLWRRFDPSKVVRNGYTSKVQYATFAIPFLSGFSGTSPGWIQSYFDMSEYAGQKVRVRFHFGTDDNTGVDGGGWIVDGLQLIDMINFDGQATVTSADGDVAYAHAPEKGLIIDAGNTVATHEPTNTLGMSVQPNPADDLLHVRMAGAIQGSVQVSLLGADGRLALHRQLDGFAAGQVLTLDVQQVPAGMYLLQVESAAGNSMMKVVIR